MASVRKVRRKGGGTSYRVQWRDPDGSQRSKNFRQARDAKTYASQVETDKSRGDYRDPNAGRITFKAYAEEWLAVQTFNPSTREEVAARLEKHVYPHIGRTPLGKLTPSKVQAMVKALEQTAAERTNKRKPRDPAYVPRTLSARHIKTILAHVRTVLNAAVADGRIGRSPLDSSAVRPPKVHARKIVPLAAESVAAVRDAMPEPFRIVVTLAAGLGLRQGEVFGLAVDDVDFLRGEVHVRRQVKILNCRPVFALPKGGKTRTVPLPESVKDALAAHLAASPATVCELPWGEVTGRPESFGLVVTNEAGKPLNRNRFNARVLKPAVIAAGLEPSRDNMTHAFRHWYASVLLASGESIRTVADYLGHSDPAFTLRTYAHLMPESAASTRKAVDNAFSSVPTTPHVAEMLPPGASALSS